MFFGAMAETTAFTAAKVSTLQFFLAFASEYQILKVKGGWLVKHISGNGFDEVDFVSTTLQWRVLIPTALQRISSRPRPAM